MVIVKLNNEFRNDYKIKNDNELKRKSLEVFCGLEHVVKTYKNFIRKESYYTDNLPFWRFGTSKGKMVYTTNPDENNGKLEISFFAGYSSIDEKYYNTLKICLNGDSDKVNLKIIDDLTAKFKSYEKEKQD